MWLEILTIVVLLLIVAGLGVWVFILLRRKPPQPTTPTTPTDTTSPGRKNVARAFSDLDAGTTTENASDPVDLTLTVANDPGTVVVSTPMAKDVSVKVTGRKYTWSLVDPGTYTFKNAGKTLAYTITGTPKPSGRAEMALDFSKSQNETRASEGPVDLTLTFSDSPQGFWVTTPVAKRTHYTVSGRTYKTSLVDDGTYVFEQGASKARITIGEQPTQAGRPLTLDTPNSMKVDFSTLEQGVTGIEIHDPLALALTFSRDTDTLNVTRADGAQLTPVVNGRIYRTTLERPGTYVFNSGGRTLEITYTDIVGAGPDTPAQCGSDLLTRVCGESSAYALAVTNGGVERQPIGGPGQLWTFEDDRFRIGPEYLRYDAATDEFYLDDTGTPFSYVMGQDALVLKDTASELVLVASRQDDEWYVDTLCRGECENRTFLGALCPSKTLEHAPALTQVDNRLERQFMRPDDPTQYWVFEGDGQTRVKNVASGEYLSVDGYLSADGMPPVVTSPLENIMVDLTSEAGTVQLLKLPTNDRTAFYLDVLCP